MMVQLQTLVCWRNFAGLYLVNIIAVQNKTLTCNDVWRRHNEYVFSQFAFFSGRASVYTEPHFFAVSNTQESKLVWICFSLAAQQCSSYISSVLGICGQSREPVTTCKHSAVYDFTTYLLMSFSSTGKSRIFFKQSVYMILWGILLTPSLAIMATKFIKLS